VKQRTYSRLNAAILAASLLAAPTVTIAEEMQQDDRAVQSTQSRRPGFPHILGSIVFTTLHVPFKLISCVGTQTLAAVAYTGTFGVEGNYEEGTNGREIGEVARRSCTGSWIVRPSQVVRDYGE
jgi:hypothetical protein